MISESGSWDSAGHWRKLWPGTEPVQPSNKKNKLNPLMAVEEERKAWSSIEAVKNLCHGKASGRIWFSDQMSPNEHKSKWFWQVSLSHLSRPTMPDLCWGTPRHATWTRSDVSASCGALLLLWRLNVDSMLTQRWVSKKNSSRRGAWFQPRISPWWPGDAWDTGTWVTIKKTNGRQRDQHKPT